MGCITSRGGDWPPKPYKHVVVRETLIERVENGEVVKIRVPVEDYVWIRPGDSRPSAGGVSTRWDEEASPGQESAIRNLEGE